MKNLEELTKQESGIVVYSNNEGILCNWASIEGFPRMFIAGLIGMGEELEDDYEVSDIDDLEAEIYAVNIIYSDMDEDQIAEEFSKKVSAKVYTFEDGTKVYAPSEWP